MSSAPKWSLRNGSQYQRLCARAGCGAPASVTLRFQPTQRQAWLVELDEHAARTQGDLCNRHAAALVLPRGWELHDERASNGSKPLVAGGAPDAINGNGARRVRVRRKAAVPAPTAEAEQLPGLDAEADARNEVSVVEVPVESPLDATVDEPSPARLAQREDAPLAQREDAPLAQREDAPLAEGEDAPADERVEDDAGDEPEGRPVVVQFGTSDDDDVEEALGAILDARTPLLQRAFRNSKPL